MNTIHVIECLVDEYGWDVLMEMAESDEDLEEVIEILDVAIAVNEGKGQLFVL